MHTGVINTVAEIEWSRHFDQHNIIENQNDTTLHSDFATTLHSDAATTLHSDSATVSTSLRLQNIEDITRFFAFIASLCIVLESRGRKNLLPFSPELLCLRCTTILEKYALSNQDQDQEKSLEETSRSKKKRRHKK